MIDPTRLIHYAPGGGKSGPRGLAQWHLAGGWGAWHERLMAPAEGITRRAMIWTALGYNGMIVLGFDRALIEWAVVCACMSSSDALIVNLAATLPDYIEDLASDNWDQVLMYGGCPLYDPAVLRYRSMERKSPVVTRMARLERSIYRGTVPCFDKTGRADASWLDFFAEVSEGGPYFVEGRLHAASSLNRPEIGKIIEYGSLTMRDESAYIPVEELTGEVVVLIRPRDGDMTELTQQVQGRGLTVCCDVTELRL